MNLLEKALDGFQELLRVNPSTLSGAIDIVVVKKDDGSLVSTPYHVRFGKLQLMFPYERTVSIVVNSKLAPFHMKLGSAGEAFFVEESDEMPPVELSTSPIVSPVGSPRLSPEQEHPENCPPLEVLPLSEVLERMYLEQQQEREQEGLELNQQLEQQPIQNISPELPVQEHPENCPPLEVLPLSEVLERMYLEQQQEREQEGLELNQQLEQQPIQNEIEQQPMQDQEEERKQDQESRKDNLSENRSIKPLDPQELDQDDDIRWDWGSLPHEVKTRSVVLEDSDMREDVNPSILSDKAQDLNSAVDTKSPVPHSQPLQVPSSFEEAEPGWRSLFRFWRSPPSTKQELDSHLEESASQDHMLEEDSELVANVEEGRTSSEDDKEDEVFAFEDDVTTTPQMDAVIVDGQQVCSSDNGHLAQKVQSEEIDLEVSSLTVNWVPASVAGAASVDGREKEISTSVIWSKPELECSVESGPSDQMNSEACSPTSPPISCSDYANKATVSTNVNNDEKTEIIRAESPGPQSASYEGPGEDKLLDDNELLDIVSSIHMSLCGEVFSSANEEQEKEEVLFEEHRLTYPQLVANPNILFSNKLMFRVNGKIFPALVGAPVVSSMLLFRRRLDSTVVDSLIAQHSPKKSNRSRSWLWWRATPKNATESISRATSEPVPTTSQLGGLPSPPLSVGDPESPQSSRPGSPVHPRWLRKTVYPTPEMLAQLDLNYGVNTVVFRVQVGQRVREVTCSLYMLRTNSKIVVSDIDGTITRSDVMGHLLYAIGKDWSQSGVAQLFSNIRDHGYHIFYLTSRPIGQARYTREFIQSLKQVSGDGGPELHRLPEGPVFMAPCRLLAAFDRELLSRRPEEYKVACLTDILRFFPPGSRPFYAGFGNKLSDVRTYQSVGIPPGKIFTVNHRGDIRTGNYSYRKNYHKLNELVDEMFPSFEEERDADPINEQYNDSNFWALPLPKIPEL